MRDWSGIRKILCVRLDNMGDVLMTTPAMSALRNLNDTIQITLLTSGTGAAVASHLPQVSEAIRYNAPWVKPGDNVAPPDLGLISDLARGDFDAAVIFTTYSQSALPAALLCYFAGIPRRLAYCRENPYRLLTEWVAEVDHDERKGGIPQVRHEVRRHLDLVASVGAVTSNERLTFVLHAHDRACLEGKLCRLGIRHTDNLLVVHPGATASSRRWAPEKFAIAAKQLRQRLDCDIVVAGSSSERTLCEDLQQAVGERAHTFAGELTLGEFGALIKSARVLLSNNSGPVHIAAALGTPVVDLYALTNPQHTPWQVPHRVLSHDVPCRYCYKSVCPQGHHHCLAQIEPSEAVAAVMALWEPQQVNDRIASAPVLVAC